MSGVGFSVSRPDVGKDKTLVAASGEIDLSTAEAFERELTRAIEERAPNGIVVDLSRVTFMDSTALNCLVRCFEAQSRRLRSMSVVTRDPRLLILLEITRLDRILTIHPTRREALADGAAGAAVGDGR